MLVADVIRVSKIRVSENLCSVPRIVFSVHFVAEQ